MDRAFERFKTEADKGSGLHYELYVQRFTDSVDALIQRTKRTDLREYIHSKAVKDDDYLPSEEGRWIYQHEENEMVFSPNRAEEAKKSFYRLMERMESVQRPKRSRFIGCEIFPSTGKSVDAEAIPAFIAGVTGSAPVGWGAGKPKACRQGRGF